MPETEAERQRGAARRASAAGFRPLVAILAALYGIFAIADLTFPLPSSRAMAPLDAAAALLLATAFIATRGRTLARGDLAVTAAFVLAVTMGTTRILVSGSPTLAMGLVLALLAAGALLYVPWTLALVQGLVAIGWTVATRGAIFAQPWLPWTFVLLAGIAVSTIVAATRIRLFRDAERHRAALEESEARYRALVEGSPDGIVVLVDAQVVYANPAAASIFGAARAEELVGRAGMTLIAPESARLIMARNRDVELRGVSTRPVEVKAQRIDGRQREVEIWGMPVLYGGRTADLSIVRDLTEKRRMEAERSRLTGLAADHAVTRELVRRMLRESAGTASMRALGRVLAGELRMRTLAEYLHAFEAMGGGRLVVEEQGKGRFLVRGRDLLEVREGASQPTCELPLGFLEGAIGRILGPDALGTETRCRSLGHEACVFVVMARPTMRVIAPAGLGKPS